MNLHEVLGRYTEISDFAPATPAISNNFDWDADPNQQPIGPN